MPTPVCAVAVTFHPGEDVVRNFEAVAKQVQSLIVVDNGSAEVELVQLREAARSIGFGLIENGENLGIAAALNAGIARGNEKAVNAYLLLDQDAQLEEGYVAAMVACLAAAPERVAIMVPRMVDARFGNAIPHLRTAEGDVEVAITSGSLIPRWVFEKAGMFAEELFIDQVDSEYSLRVRSMGFTIAECPNAVLQHAPATPSYHRVSGWKAFQVTNYSPTRRYYQSRNLVWMWRHYAKEFPIFMAVQRKIFLKDFAKTAWEQDPFAKLAAVATGLWDGFRGRMGARKR